jgi:dephospho-CoA kinase
MLLARGAVLVDADGVAREIQRRGGVAFQPMVDRFGEGIVGPDGELDRPAIATIVFSDKQALADLNAITWPLIGHTINERINANATTDNIVILDIPLLGASGNNYTTAGTVVVDCPVEIALDRLVQGRGMDRADAERRVAAQIAREERLALADFVVDNSGSHDDLALGVDACWAWVKTLSAEVNAS